MMDEFEQMQLDNFLGVYNIGAFDAALRTGYKYLEEAKQLYVDYVTNGGEFPEDNLNDMKKYALDNFNRANAIVKGDIKCLPAACKKSTAYKKARAAYTAAVNELLAAIEAFEVEIEVVDEVEIEESVETVADVVLVETYDAVAGVAAGVQDKASIDSVVQELMAVADELGLPELKHVAQHLQWFYNRLEIGPAIWWEITFLRRAYLDRLALIKKAKNLNSTSLKRNNGVEGGTTVTEEQHEYSRQRRNPSRSEHKDEVRERGSGKQQRHLMAVAGQINK